MVTALSSRVSIKQNRKIASQKMDKKLIQTELYYMYITNIYKINVTCNLNIILILLWRCR